MAGEQGLSVNFEVGLICIHHTVEPWQKLFGTVVRVEDDGNAIGGSNRADVVRCSCSSSNGGSLVFVVYSLSQMLEVVRSPRVITADLASEICSTSLGGLEDDGSICITSSFQRSHYS